MYCDRSHTSDLKLNALDATHAVTATRSMMQRGREVIRRQSGISSALDAPP